MVSWTVLFDSKNLVDLLITSSLSEDVVQYRSRTSIYDYCVDRLSRWYLEVRYIYLLSTGYYKSMYDNSQSNLSSASNDSTGNSHGLCQATSGRSW